MTFDLPTGLPGSERAPRRLMDMWMAHDVRPAAQAVRGMTGQYREAVGQSHTSLPVPDR